MPNDTGLRFRVVTDDQLRRLHAASLEVLESTGVEVYSERGRAVFEHSGAIVEKERVRIPAKVVERALSLAPKRCAVHDRNGEVALQLGDTRPYFGTGSECPYFLDCGAHKPRSFTLDDIVKGTIVSDCLDEISFIMCLGIPMDVPAERSDLYAIRAMLSHSTKPFVFNTHDIAGCKKVVQMASVIAGGEASLRTRPFLLLYAQPTSPLRISEPVADKIAYMAEAGLPIVTAAGIMAGATAPCTIAGRMVQANAEMLAQLVLAEVVREGTAVVYGAMCTPLDLKTMSHAHGTPEAMIAQSGMAELARSYGLPTWGGGGCSASKLPDEQAVWEAGTTALTGALSGINMIHDVGFLESARTYSLEMLVMACGLISSVKKMLEGIDTSEDNLAVDAIRRVGPGGTFLEDEHTLRHMREAWESDLIDRNLRSVWEEKGMQTMRERAQRKLKEILFGYSPRVLPRNAAEKLDQIVG